MQVQRGDREFVMKELVQQVFTGERALFKSEDLKIKYSTFRDGESPLKESSAIKLFQTNFEWKYPLWYCRDIELENCNLAAMARAGIWYTDRIRLLDCIIEAPKSFRRSSDITLSNVDFTDAAETLWHCRGVSMNSVHVRGDYFAMNSSELQIGGLNLVGNYSFDGAKNVVMTNSKLLSKDAFWNAENVLVTDSYICGEYIGWNARDVTFKNCVIESLQGFCYMDNVKLNNCRLINTNLSFEYSTVDADVISKIDSVKNPLGGRIRAQQIDEIIFDDPKISREQTEITVSENTDR